ncbi:MAG TPA: polysaccharide biosynthesis/export family protein [Kofleriaceae bacterium]|nr:polysaccharide biosynthesis/export family protein [Kofleriaceae bacterium]
MSGHALHLASLAAVAASAAAPLGCSDPPPSNYPAQIVYAEDGTVDSPDLLEVRVAKQDQLTGDYEIDANGQISFPYAGTIDARGKTPLQIQQVIHDRLADGYLRDPQVIVRVKESRSKQVSVFGEVRKGAVVQFQNGMTIVQAISEAGGFTPRAWENAVRVTRKTATAATEYTVPVKNIANGTAAPFYMRPGDSVYVPKSPM